MPDKRPRALLSIDASVNQYLYIDDPNLLLKSIFLFYLHTNIEKIIFQCYYIRQ